MVVIIIIIIIVIDDERGHLLLRLFGRTGLIFVNNKYRKTNWSRLCI